MRPSIDKQLKAIRQHFDYTQAELSEETGVDLRRIQNIESGKVQKFNPAEIEILTKLGFSEIWLKTGIGEMLENQLSLKHSDDFLLVPYYNHLRVSAGTGLELWEEEADGVDEIPRRFFKGIKSLENIRCIRVSGYSMTPRYDDGDYIFVDISHIRPNAEGIYVIGVEGMLLVKLIQWIPGGLRLISYNKDFEPLDLTEETYDPESVRIIGRVVAAFTYA